MITFKLRTPVYLKLSQWSLYKNQENISQKVIHNTHKQNRISIHNI